MINDNVRFVYKAARAVTMAFIAYSFASILILVLMDGGYPESAQACFDMLEQNRFAALLKLDILSILIIPLYGVLFYAIFLLLEMKNDSIGRAAFFCILAGIIVFMGSVNLQSLINIYERYAATSDDETRKLCLAAGEAMLADDMWRNTGFLFRGFLIESGALYFSLAMVGKGPFARGTAFVGIVTHSFDLLSLLAGIFFPFAKVIFTAVAGPLYIVWFILLFRDLGKLTRDAYSSTEKGNSSS